MMQHSLPTLRSSKKKYGFRAYDFKRCFPLIAFIATGPIDAYASPPAGENEGERPQETTISPTASDYETFYFQVFLNQQDQQILSPFKRAKNGEWLLSSSTAREMRLRIPKDSPKLLKLDALPLTYRIDESAQAIYLEIAAQHLLPKVYSQSSGLATSIPYTPSAFAWITNYHLFAQGSSKRAQGDSNAVQPWNLNQWSLNGWAANFDSRLTGEFGTVVQSGYVSNEPYGSFKQEKNVHWRRLETAWTYNNPDTGHTYRVGDSISNSLNWNRSIRFAGVHFDQNFENRADLITLPLPEVMGTAAVPSVVDVYLGKKVITSQQVEAGPFHLTGLPIYTGNGQAQVIVRDASGREVVTQVPFSVSNRLLKKNALAYAVDIGVPRVGYGTKNDLYINSLVGNVSARYGLSSNFTVEGHVEGNTDLINGGLGFVWGIPNFGLLSASWSHSFYHPHENLSSSPLSARSQNGNQLAVGLQTRLGPFHLSLYSQRTFGGYQDLASTLLNPRLAPIGLLPSIDPLLPSLGGPLLPQSRLPQNPQGEEWWSAIKQIDRISISTSAPWKGGSLGLSYVQGKNYTPNHSMKVVSFTYSQSLWQGANLHVGAYIDLNKRSPNQGFAHAPESIKSNLSLGNDVGVYFSLSMPLSDRIQANASYQSNPYQKGLSLDVGTNNSHEINSLDWRIRADTNPQRYTGAATYTSPYNRVRGQIQQTPGTGTSGAISAEGSLVISKQGLVLGQSIHDSFALVDVGAPGVTIEHQGRKVARSNMKGKAVVSTLSPHFENRISIDAKDLPINAFATSTREIVRPKPKSAVAVNFAARLDSASALVLFQDSQGNPIAPGTQGFDSENQVFTVGYDGIAFIENLKANNIVTLQQVDKECRAQFPYRSDPHQQVRIGPVACF